MRMDLMWNNDKTIDEVTAVLKALAEPNRLRIFAELMNGDSCYCELQANLDLAPNLLSHHLRILTKAGLVHSRRDKLDGRWIYYAVDRDMAGYWQIWLHDFLDPTRIHQRIVCGPEGQAVLLEKIAVT